MKKKEKPKIRFDKDGIPMIEHFPSRVWDENGKIMMNIEGLPDNCTMEYEFNEETQEWEQVFYQEFDDKKRKKYDKLNGEKK